MTASRCVARERRGFLVVASVRENQGAQNVYKMYTHVLLALRTAYYITIPEAEDQDAVAEPERYPTKLEGNIARNRIKRPRRHRRRHHGLHPDHVHLRGAFGKPRTRDTTANERGRTAC